MSTLAQLDQAAKDVVGEMKKIKEYADAKVAVIGGLALWNYIKSGRTTKDVDFIITIDSAPASVKQKLLALPHSPFRLNAQIFSYVTKDNRYVQIDITPGWQAKSPYVPSSARKLKDIPKGTVPYISLVDLVVFKINSCGLRAQGQKKTIDALDAQALLMRSGPVALTPELKRVVENGLPDVLHNSQMPEEWWRKNLGLPAKPTAAGPSGRGRGRGH